MAKQKIEELGAESSFSPKEIAEKFFEQSPDYPNESVYVTSDGVVYHGNLKGKNHADNYTKANTGTTYEEVFK